MELGEYFMSNSNETVTRDSSRGGLWSVSYPAMLTGLGIAWCSSQIFRNIRGSYMLKKISQGKTHPQLGK